MKYIQGDNVPPIKTGVVQSGIDLTGYLAKVRMTASFSGLIIGGALAVDTILKIDLGIQNLLARADLGVGIRALIHRTKEWILITAIDGTSITVTRAQNDPGGIATIAKDVFPSDILFICPIDSVPITAQIDPAVPANEGAILSLNKNNTKIPVGEYVFEVAFESGDLRIHWKDSNKLIIEIDPNYFGAP